MKTDLNKRQVPIFNAKTGKSRLSEPLPVRAPHKPVESPVSSGALAPLAPMPSLTPSSSFVDGTSRPQQVEAVNQEQVSLQKSEEVLDFHTGAGVTREPTKGKSGIETLEQFLTYVYARKGQRVSLKPKVERNIAGNLQLDEGAISRLMALVDSDICFLVPRQLLLVSREVEGFPALRAAILSFIKNVMLRHPAFATSIVQSAVNNLPDGPAMADAIEALTRYDPTRVEGIEGMKPAELQIFRRNAANLLAAWFICSRGSSLEELASALLRTLWAPASRELIDDNARLRALTEIEQLAGVGLVCERFRQQALKARAALDGAERYRDALLLQVSQLEQQVEQATQALELGNSKFEELRSSTADELAQQLERHKQERMHLRHNLEQLRGRLARRLDDSIEMLEVGLTALRNKTPRTEVMLERAEHVVDALRADRKNLNEE